MKTIKGDLIKYALNGVFDVIVHGCNCHCAMNVGRICLINSRNSGSSPEFVGEI